MAASPARRRTAAALTALLLAALGAAAVPGYAAFLRPAAAAPADACAEGRPDGGGPVVVAAGASMTRGTLGHDWVADLRERPGPDGRVIVDAGINGDTSAGLLGRVDDDVVACDPDAVVLLIGTNDVRDGVPVEDYRAHLDAITARVTERTSARVALVSLPPLGEDPGADVNRRLPAYNAAVRAAAEHAGADYLPVNERFAERLAESGAGPAFGFGFGTAYLASAEHYLLGRSWDDVARGNGLGLYVDHIHLSDEGGAIVTDLVGRWLDAPPDR
jgi:lysophospholipase L1-like esterase